MLGGFLSDIVVNTRVMPGQLVNPIILACQIQDQKRILLLDNAIFPVQRRYSGIIFI
jgi:hypothetical protein